jgi:hypothetical protein
LSIVLGGGPLNVDIYPTLAVPIEVPFVGPVPASLPEGRLRVDAVALPHLVFYHPELTDAEYAQVMRHEMVHQQHWEAFGPAFPVMYVLTGGMPFEDYRGGEMYVPPQNLRQCPFVRFSTGSGASLMPCWRALFSATW